jgi:hypothetical protein
LFLGDEKGWDNGRRFVIVRVLLEQDLDGVKTSLSELKRTRFQVILGVAMVCESAEHPAWSHQVDALKLATD